MKSSPDLGNVSQEAYFLITKATECFVQHIALQAHKNSKDLETVAYKQLGKIEIALTFLPLHIQGIDCIFLIIQHMLLLLSNETIN